MRLSHLLCIALSVSALMAADQGVTDSQIATLRSAVQQGAAQRRSAQLEILRKAALTPQSALKYFYECIEKCEFKGNNLNSGQFHKWKQDYEQKTKGLPIALALQHQLQFLYLHRAEDCAEESEKAGLTKLWLAWLERLSDDSKSLATCQDILVQPLGRSVFFNALEMQGEPAFEELSLSPLQIDGVFLKFILPYTAKTEYIAIWEKRLKLQANLGEHFLLPEEWKRYNSIELPRLRAEMLLDLLDKEIGSRDENLKSLYNHISAHVSHPQARHWLDSLEQARKKEPATAESKAS